MTERVTQIRQLTGEVASEIVELRRAIHRRPELGWAEFETTERVAASLRTAGLDPVLRAHGVGLTVEIGEGHRAVGFRADLDGLPIEEENLVPYRSVHEGVMHACGHDAHAAIGVGVAMVLARLGNLPGRVRLLFQPAEERVPGGAVAMRDEGAHEGLDAMLAFHVDPTLEPGRVGVRQGGITGASDRIVIRLTGPGGHTSRPHQTVDLIYVASRVVTNLPVLLRYEIDPRETALIVFGRISGGSAENVIPNQVEMGGTVRMFDMDLWRQIPTRIESVLADLVTPLGAKAEVDYQRGAPPVINDAAVVGRVAAAAAACLGADGVASTHQSLGAEDFAWFLQDMPGALIRLGAALPDRRVDLHSAAFDIDEAALEAGIVVAAESLLRLLEDPVGG